MHLHGGPHNGDHLPLQSVTGHDIHWTCKCHGAVYRGNCYVTDSLFFEASDSVPLAFTKAFKELN